MFLPLLLAAVVAPAPVSSCPSSPKQEQTAAVIRKLEVEWSQAYYDGDTAFMACLQDPGFVDAQGNGRLHWRPQELSGAIAMAKRHRHFDAATAPIPTVYIHDGVAVATGIIPKPGTSGAHGRRWTDIYRYDGVHWHAFFSGDTVF